MASALGRRSVIIHVDRLNFVCASVCLYVSAVVNSHHCEDDSDIKSTIYWLYSCFYLFLGRGVVDKDKALWVFALPNVINSSKDPVSA